MSCRTKTIRVFTDSADIEYCENNRNTEIWLNGISYNRDEDNDYTIEDIDIVIKVDGIPYHYKEFYYGNTDDLYCCVVIKFHNCSYEVILQWNEEEEDIYEQLTLDSVMRDTESDLIYNSEVYIMGCKCDVIPDEDNIFNL